MAFFFFYRNENADLQTHTELQGALEKLSLRQEEKSQWTHASWL
jgi:hypothetical protein